MIYFSAAPYVLNFILESQKEQLKFSLKR